MMKKYTKFIFKRQSVGYLVIAIYFLCYTLAMAIPAYIFDSFNKIEFLNVLQNNLFNILFMWLIIFGIYIIMPSTTTLFALGGSRKQISQVSIINSIVHSLIPGFFIVGAFSLIDYISKGQTDLIFVFGINFSFHSSILAFIGKSFIVSLLSLFIINIIAYYILIFMKFKALIGLSNIFITLSILFLILSKLIEVIAWGLPVLSLIGILLLLNIIIIAINTRLIYIFEVNK